MPAGEIERAVIDQRRAVFRGARDRGGHLESSACPHNAITEVDACAALQQIDPLWDEFFPAEQAPIVELPAERVDIGTDGLNVCLHIDGLSGLPGDRVGVAA